MVSLPDSSSYGMKFENNLKLQQSELDENKTVLKSFPTRLGILFGNRCNLKCRMCGNKGLFTRVGIKKPTKFDDEALNDIISYFPYLERLVLSGGEPLVYRECKEVVEIAKRYPNIRLKIMTNGNLINDYWINRFCDAPFKYIAISMDAATEKTYKSIRIKGNFNKIISSIKQINDIKNGNEQEFQLSFVVMRRNLHEILKFVELAHSLNINQISFSAIGNQKSLFYATESVTPKKSYCVELLRLGEKLKDLADEYNIEITNRVPAQILQNSPKFFYEYHKIKKSNLNNNGDFFCDRNWKRLDISPEYTTSCCHSVPTKYTPIYFYSRNIPKIGEIWNSGLFVKARKLIVDHQYDKVCWRSCGKYFNYLTQGVL